MNIRAIAGIIVGLVFWWVLFIGVGIAFGLMWPDYRAAARVMFNGGGFGEFTTVMLLLNFVVFIIAGLVDGWLVSTISRNRIAGLVVAGLFLLYTLFEHYYMIWGLVADWYNVIVPWIIAGALLLGSRLVRRASPVDI